ncbi:MAG: PAS domain-containing protein [Alphaproteobacteria bacterium]|nr:PAS domain-containing protein [Alphaproteobacteria bacterium]
MIRTADPVLRLRVLILAPVGRDAALAKAVLDGAGIGSLVCGDLDELQQRLAEGAGASVLTEEALIGRDVWRFAEWINEQPSWSDFPFILLLEPGGTPEAGTPERDVLQAAGNLTLLERPVGTATLVSAVRAALRARGRQYEVQDAIEALTASERRYRTLAEALPQLVWTSKPDGQRDYFSRQGVEYTGIPEEDQLGLAWLEKVVHPDDRERTRKRWVEAVQGKNEYDAELRIRRADNEYRWFKARGTPVRDNGRTVKWFGTCTDITDIVEARETLRRGREELERLVTDRTRSLAAANDRLTAEIAERQRTEAALLQAQKLEAVGQLTSGVAHDFNNLLTAILGNLEMMERRLKSEEPLRRLQAARLAAERGARLTHQLLAFSRKQRLAPTPLDLNRLVSEASDMLFRTIGATVRIETVLTDGLWPALVDPTQIELVLLNLAINARDAMPEGGRLTIRTANVVRSGAPPDLTPGDYVLISVSDTGQGMSEEVRRRSVEPFFTTKEPGKGSGLGLSMVHGVATQSGGGLQIDSRLGCGTTVSVYLPRARRPSAPRPEREARSAAVHDRATILVVDDDPEVREVAVSSLADLGYRMLAAENGPLALQLLAQNGPVDLLLVDMAMPGMNGVELIRRARECQGGLKAMLVTGYADVAAFAPAEGDLVLQKPYRLERLAETVAEALRRKPRLPGSNVVAMKPTPRTA